MEVSALKNVLLMSKEPIARQIVKDLNNLEGRPFKNGLTLQLDQANLGLASTGELLEELTARAQLGGYEHHRPIDAD